ncbi:hypothetical protein GUITHDRAFT_119939 [Guillardia theta CCMP2712]|uniref:Uncharacterized protein n=1 Tax=Guillardia theta (strain CCMP2712) TaxID=905079 RepID=L1IDA8_GUITC|nr:hypothetical protein GUITHDRAFT_119939 [Guillardia theta CCMP2712]EKX33894.1 hypothetical protein GUITHDRAFT_119939 [Guillardia theta CCMP2712]|eukprot:XP_005820874.1 hypothetical protein GUITHDRAFT_119939 [Guillardia theta CCMP2712]
MKVTRGELANRQLSLALVRRGERQERSRRSNRPAPPETRAAGASALLVVVAAVAVAEAVSAAAAAAAVAAVAAFVLKKSLKRRLKTQLLHFEVVTGGITLGGLPIGTDGFHASQLRAKVSTLNEELSKLGLVQHGFMFKTLVRASHLQKLRFFLQGSSPFLPRVQSQIRRFDLSVHLALEKYHRWPSSQYLAAHPDLLEFARFKRELPHSRGGDEFTPSEGLHPAVYYTAIARFLACLDVHCSRSLRAQKHPLATFFVEAHDFVHNAGAILYRRVRAPAPAADGAAIPPAPAAVPDDAGRPPASVVHIPGLRALVDSSHEHFIPPPAQRNVTPLVMRVFPRHVHARAALTDQQRDILTSHSRRTHSLKSQDRVLQSTIFAHFPERDLSHSPMRVSSYYPLKAFPHRYAQMLDCYLHGMPICQCPTECDGCQRELDPSVAAHHLQTCKRRSSKLPTAHDNLTRTIRSMLNEAGLQSVIDTVGDPRSRRQVPSHPHGRKMKGDIHIPGIRDRGSEQYEGLMADVTLVHPYIGSSADLTKWGEVNLDALHVAASEKIRKHRAAYAMTTPPRAFIPLAISTDGTLHPDTLRFIWYLADIIAQRSMPLEDAAAMFANLLRRCNMEGVEAACLRGFALGLAIPQWIYWQMPRLGASSAGSFLASRCGLCAWRFSLFLLCFA